MLTVTRPVDDTATENVNILGNIFHCEVVRSLLRKHVYPADICIFVISCIPLFYTHPVKMVVLLAIQSDCET